MAITDAGPVESPPGIAIANGALLTCLMETLIKQGVFNKFQAANVIMAAQRELSRRPNEAVYNDARLVLKNLLLRFPAT